MFDLKGKTVLVTGSTQGIGFETADLLSKCGAKVFIHGGKSMEKCRIASDKIKNSTPVLSDLSQNNGAEILYGITGDVDILVINASIQLRRSFGDVSVEDIDIQVNTNFKSSYMMMQKYLPYMRNQRWGRIVTIGSINQYKQNPDLAVYAATKSAQLNLVQTMARENARFNVTVNNIAPGVILTPRNDKILQNAEYRQSILKQIPCGYEGIPSDISPAVMLLCSEEGRYITGADLIIDGGMHL